MSRLFTLLLFLCSLSADRLAAQQVLQHKFLLAWSEDNTLSFIGAGEFSANPALPVYTFRFPLEGSSKLSVTLTVESSEQVTITNDVESGSAEFGSCHLYRRVIRKLTGSPME